MKGVLTDNFSLFKFKKYLDINKFNSKWIIIYFVFSSLAFELILDADNFYCRCWLLN
jgi:hypothetical protein